MSAYLPQEVLNAIGHIGVRALDGSDFPVWQWSSDGLFSLKSAYDHIAGHSELENRGEWRRVWKLKVSQRYRSFLWLCLHESVMTNRVRRERGL